MSLAKNPTWVLLQNEDGSPTARGVLRAAVSTAYGLQKARIQLGNRLCALFRDRLGIAASTRPDLDQAKILKEVLADFQRITDGVVLELRYRKKFEKEMVESTILTSWGELILVEAYNNSLATEQQAMRMLRPIAESHPMWEWVSNIKGVSWTFAAIMFSELNIEKAKYPSQFWAYAGLDVVQVQGEDGTMRGEGRGRKAGHLVERTFKRGDEGETTTAKVLSHNAFLKTKLVGVMAGVMLMHGIKYDKVNTTTTTNPKTGKVTQEKTFVGYTHKYARVYAEYKARLANRADAEEKTDAHRHRMAVRYMIKILLQDLHIEWRAKEGLEVSVPYHVAKLQLRDHGTNPLEGSVFDEPSSEEVAAVAHRMSREEMLEVEMAAEMEMMEMMEGDTESSEDSE